MPYRSLPDPEIQGEVSIDPFGLMSAADNLADWILPGLTVLALSRLARVRPDTANPSKMTPEKIRDWRLLNVLITRRKCACQRQAISLKCRLFTS